MTQNVLIRALIAATGLPAHLIDLWRHGRFTLPTAPEQIGELMRVMRYPKIASVWRPRSLDG